MAPGGLFFSESEAPKATEHKIMGLQSVWVSWPSNATEALFFPGIKAVKLTRDLLHRHEKFPKRPLSRRHARRAQPRKTRGTRKLIHTGAGWLRMVIKSPSAGLGSCS